MKDKHLLEVEVILLHTQWLAPRRWLNETARIAERGIEKEISLMQRELSLTPTTGKGLDKRATGKGFDEQAKKRFQIVMKRDLLMGPCKTAIRSSTLVMAFGVMENLLSKICEAFADNKLSWPAKNSRIEIRYYDLKGEYTLDRLQKYLSKVVGIQLPPFFESEARLLSILRNAFVHQMGVIPRDSKNEIEKILRRKGSNCKLIFSDIVMGKLGHNATRFKVTLGKTFVEHMLDSMSVMFEELRATISTVQ